MANKGLWTAFSKKLNGWLISSNPEKFKPEIKKRVICSYLSENNGNIKKILHKDLNF